MKNKTNYWVNRIAIIGIVGNIKDYTSIVIYYYRDALSVGQSNEIGTTHASSRKKHTFPKKT